MGELLAGTPATMMAFDAHRAAVPGEGGALKGAMEEGKAFQSAHEAAYQRLQTAVAENNINVKNHIDAAKRAGHDYLESDEVSAARVSIVDFQMPR